MNSFESVSETCQCGAAFSVQGQNDGLLVGPIGMWRRWQEEHAVVCEIMMRQIAPMLERMAANETAREERKNKMREYQRNWHAKKKQGQS